MQEPQDRKLKIMHISGSPHLAVGSTSQVVKRIIAGIQHRCETEVQHVYLYKQNILTCRGCTRCMRVGICPLHAKDDVGLLVKQMHEADGIIISSPVYAVNVTATLKNYFDRCASLTHRPDMDDKYGIAVVSSAGLGNESVVNYIAQIMGAMGINVVGKVAARAFYLGQFDNIEQLNSDANAAGEALAEAILNGARVEQSEFEKDRRERFQSMMNMPDVGKHLFGSDYEFWKSKNWLGDKND